ncbi:HAMP domain-containing protein [Paenibacillus farraposensis]|uniref:HAMP domain-containing protein n=1 Tax=Paenibacillus farraposensis TaxID=2807095 RepID=UPI001E379B7F
MPSKIAQGDLSQEANVHGNNEIAQLARSFQSMSHNLKEMISHVLSYVRCGCKRLR